jgi:hypothetical protein
VATRRATAFRPCRLAGREREVAEVVESVALTARLSRPYVLVESRERSTGACIEGERGERTFFVGCLLQTLETGDCGRIHPAVIPLSRLLTVNMDLRVADHPAPRGWKASHHCRRGRETVQV